MREALDLTGLTFGRLTALAVVGSDARKNRLWLCRCDCGNETTVRAAALNNGSAKSCGCHWRAVVAARYGRLAVIGEVTPRSDRRHFSCRCDCGAVTVASLANLKAGSVKSCGCLRHDTTPNKTHGLSKEAGRKTRLFRIWSGMRTRCMNPNDHTYRRYGGRGIAICPEWHDFEAFHSWAMAHGYEPSNCRWATYKEQANNRRSTKKEATP